MTVNEKLAHQPLSAAAARTAASAAGSDKRVQELASAAEAAWQNWDHRPKKLDAEGSAEWMKDQREAMNNLGAALMLFGLAGAVPAPMAGQAADPRERNSKADPRQHGSI